MKFNFKHQDTKLEEPWFDSCQGVYELEPTTRVYKLVCRSS